ncbi:MAG: (2Fe-2S)-binding protein, partial [Flavobacteriaceae bacterium]|nr:(2Fe-2S)-binding protein [Flavobacteriaceae bacterium]
QPSDRNIVGVVEIEEFDNFLYGITCAAEQQANVAVNFILGDLNSVYIGSVLMNILKFKDLHLCSIGLVQFPEKDTSYEEVIFMDMHKHYYKKCIIKNDRLIGAVLLGDKKEFAEFKILIEDKIELGEKREELLRSNEEFISVKGKLICSCSQIGIGNLEDVINSGCINYTELCKTTGAGMGCGSCKPEVLEIFQNTLRKKLATI